MGPFVAAVVFFISLSSFALESEGMKLKDETIHNASGVVWSFDFLPDNRIVYTMRSGKMFLLDLKSKNAKEITGVPKVAEKGQGGLLDVRVHPDFKKTNLIFFTYSEPLEGGMMTTALGGAKLDGTKLADTKKLFSAKASNKNTIHFGSRLAFTDKYLFMTVGDRDERHNAQKLTQHNGKVLRFNMDGTVPKDNPFAGKGDALPEIYSYGHRNPQGLAIHPTTGEVWEAEMGPRGGDEINLIKPGANYGWPVVTFGREYAGPKIGEGTEKAGIENPIVHWVPSISPSNIAFYNSDVLPKWKGNLFLGNLSGAHIRRVVLDGKKVVKQEEVLKGDRYRNLRSGPDGFLYYSTDSGKIGRLTPENTSLAGN